MILQTIFTPPTTSLSCLMALFGQEWPERAIYRASVQGHERYAATWGYGYALETCEYKSVEGTKAPYLNKVHALLRLAERELAKGHRGAEWILTADSDILILNPSIPLTLFLPPEDRHPSATILANQDHNGLNAGVFFWRVTPRLVAFLTALLSYEPTIYADMGRHPSDQHLTGYALQQSDQVDFAAGFYEIPQNWLNGYFLPTKEPGGEGRQPAALIHLVNWRKWQEDWKRTVQRPVENIYKDAMRRAAARGTGVREALMDTDSWREAKRVTEDWWRDEAQAGTANMYFNEY